MPSLSAFSVDCHLDEPLINPEAFASSTSNSPCFFPCFTKNSMKQPSPPFDTALTMSHRFVEKSEKPCTFQSLRSRSPSTVANLYRLEPLTKPTAWLSREGRLVWLATNSEHCPTLHSGEVCSKVSALSRAQTYGPTKSIGLLHPEGSTSKILVTAVTTGQIERSTRVVELTVVSQEE